MFQRAFYGWNAEPSTSETEQRCLRVKLCRAITKQGWLMGQVKWCCIRFLGQNSSHPHSEQILQILASQWLTSKWPFLSNEWPPSFYLINICNQVQHTHFFFFFKFKVFIISETFLPGLENTCSGPLPVRGKLSLPCSISLHKILSRSFPLLSVGILWRSCILWSLENNLLGRARELSF